MPKNEREQKLRSIVSMLDLPCRWVGLATAWLALPLIGCLVYEVVLRYIFNSPTMWAYDITYMLTGTMFMLGAAWTLGEDRHVRADFLFNIMSPRWQGALDGVMTLCLFLPAIFFFTLATLDYAADSWARSERIITSPWMPIIYPFKTVMPIAGVLLLIQGISELIKSVYAVKTNRHFREQSI
jgi:TRAP-type mannitol/chloroaromatic compound transport system permease small subunit